MILVTGSTGFIGQHLVRSLFAQGEKVRCLVRKHSRTDTIQQLGVELFEGDICRTTSLQPAFDDIQYVIHLAGVINTLHPRDYEIINVGGTNNILRASIRASVKKFVFLSSYSAKDIFSGRAYGASKRQAEELIKKSGITFTILRPPVVYGKGDNKNLAHLIQMVKKSPIIPILGSGKVRFQPIYVGDVVKVLIDALRNPQTDGQVYDIAGPEQVTMEEIIDLICQKLSVKRFRLHIPYFIVVPLVMLYQAVFPKPVTTIEQLFRMRHGNSFIDISTMVNDFAFHPTSINNGLDFML